LRPTIAGETAGEGTIATVGAGEKDGGSIEGIILVNGVGWGVEKREVERRMTPDDKHLSDRTLHASQATHLLNAGVSCRVMGMNVLGKVCCVAMRCAGR